MGAATLWGCGAHLGVSQNRRAAFRAGGLHRGGWAQIRKKGAVPRLHKQVFPAGQPLCGPVFAVLGRFRMSCRILPGAGLGKALGMESLPHTSGTARRPRRERARGLYAGGCRRKHAAHSRGRCEHHTGWGDPAGPPCEKGKARQNGVAPLSLNINLYFIIPLQNTRYHNELHRKGRIYAIFCLGYLHQLAQRLLSVFLRAVGAQVFSFWQYL